MIDSPRFDLVAAKYGRGLAVVFLVVGLSALTLTGWAVATPETTTVTQEVGEERIETDVTTTATVVQDGLWANGTTLESSPVYLYTDTPELTVTAETAVTDSGTPLEEAAVEHDLFLRYEAERDGEVFWSDHKGLDDEPTVSAGGQANTSATIDVRAVRERILELEDTLTGVGDISVSVGVETAYDTRSNGGAESDTVPLELTGSAYWLDGTHEIESTHPETASVEIAESPNVAVVGAGSFLAALSLLGAVLVVSRSSTNVAAARKRIHRQRHDEWISTGSIPMWIGEHNLELETLEDVVDVAIDTNERVVHDTQRDLFAVVNGDVVYYYSDRGGWGETAWPTVEINHDSETADPTTFDRQQAHTRSDSAPASLPEDDTAQEKEHKKESQTEREAEDETGEATGTGEEPDSTTFTQADLPDPDDDDAWDQI
ncbi:DUF5305 domain-containing protein [Natronobacterium gregoryi]|uniref:DUF5305 domain-containing protein n=2 Tax=Natronobacterium gregoryi TaxID=44930 RepID=L0AM30_NATGS|nr:DUF5305 domain-containing protein [Natronobacterium gregoryi]AFZ74514.1 hypothetical protein Natgr_3394 [Natronobacterium gregoryi SP2]ELY72412.1 hypothetical protein C490_03673 [Natronobacterium gregoryi SP2]PLK21740.1 hypothetical protein CYV19_02580 [Natronobacterium gregoryi SP2]SFI97794.1 hypothetical protein SAMN05443661_110193 [Natronobacterium gregoryi]